MDKMEFGQKIDRIADLLYQNREQEGYAELAGFLPQIQAMGNRIIECSVSAGDKERKEKMVLSHLRKIIDAYQDRDILLLADILKYELLCWNDVN